MQELTHEKRKISSTPGTNPECFVVDGLGNFYGVIGYGDAFGRYVYEITPQINLAWGGFPVASGLVRHCWTTVRTGNFCIGGLAIVAQRADSLIRRAFSSAGELLFLETELILSPAIEIAAQ